MNNLPAYCVYRVFEPEPLKSIQFDRHYLLYSAKGTLRLEAEDKSWVLPPSRAAWVAANVPIKIDIKQRITCCSVLFATNFIEAPSPACKVFDMTSLTREMILECRQWGPAENALSIYASQFFHTLALTCHSLSKNVCNTWTPLGKSEALKQALTFTQNHLGHTISFPDVAKSVHLSERSLARRFSNETNMTWRQVRRRMRMIRAIELLASGNLQITNVAIEVGYNSLSAFNSAFCEFTGKTPSEYQKEINTHT